VLAAVVVVVKLVDPGGSAPTRDASAVGPTTTALQQTTAPQLAISTPTSVAIHRESPSPLSAAAKFSPILVTMAGQVAGTLPDGDFLVNNGEFGYIVAMSGARVIDVTGAEVGRQMIQVGVPVRITGTLSGMRITAPTVVIATGESQP
jgi:hypothetical protein